MFIRLCMQLITFTFYEDFQKHSLNFLLFRQLKVQLTRVEGFYKKWIWPRPSHSTPKACCYIYRLFCCYCAGKNSIPNHLFQIWWPTGCLAGQIWKLHFQDRLYHPMLVERDWMASFKNLTCIWSNSLHFLSVAIQSSLQQYVGLFSSLWLLILLGIPEILNNST